MGLNFSEIDFGQVENSAGGGAFGTLAVSPRNGWLAEAQSFEFAVAKTGTRQIKITFKITDPDAVNTDEETYTGKVWDAMYFTEKSAKMTKMKLKGLGFPAEDLVVGSDDDIQDLAEDLQDKYTGLPVRVVTEIEEQEGRDPRARVKFVNEVK